MHIWVYSSLDLIVAKKKKNKKEKSRLSQSVKNYENICVRFQEIMAHLNTVKGQSSLKDTKVVLKLHFVCVLLEFFQIFGQSLS